MAGAPTTKSEIDAQTAAVVVSLRDSLDRAQRISLWLSGKTDAEVTALGYSSGEVSVLKSAFTQLNQLRTVATGQATVVSANDFLFFARQLTGLL